MCSQHHHTDEQHCHPDPEEARGHIKRRLDGRAPTSYPTTAAVLASATCAAWGVLIYSGIIHRDRHLTYGTAVCLAFCLILAVAAGFAVTTWLQARRDHETTRINTLIGEYRHSTLLDEIRAIHPSTPADTNGQDWQRTLQSIANHMDHANGNKATHIATPLLPRSRSGDS